MCLQLKIREVRQKMMARPNSPNGGGTSSSYTAASSAPGTPLSAPPVASIHQQQHPAEIHSK